MLMNLHKKVWTDVPMMKDFKLFPKENQEHLERMVVLADSYKKRALEGEDRRKDAMKTRYIGEADRKKHLEQLGEWDIEENIVGVLVKVADPDCFPFPGIPNFPHLIASYSKLVGNHPHDTRPAHPNDYKQLVTASSATLRPHLSVQRNDLQCTAFENEQPELEA